MTQPVNKRLVRADTSRRRTLLSRWFNNRRRIFFLTKTNNLQLGFNARLVYSFLVSQCPKNRSVARRDIALATGIDEFRTLKKTVIPQLMDFGLVDEQSGELRACEPVGATADWFAIRCTKAEQWWDRLGYFPLYLRSRPSPLSTRTNALMFLLYSLARGGTVASGQTHKGMATMLSVSPRTVASGLEKLCDVELTRLFAADKDTGWFAVGLYKPTTRHLAWFQRAKKIGELEYPGLEEFRKQSERDQTEAPDCRATTGSPPRAGRASHTNDLECAPMEDRSHPRWVEITHMRARGYPKPLVDQIVGLLTTSFGRDIDLRNFLSVLDAVDGRHRRNRTDGRFRHVQHSANLLIYEIRQWIERQQTSVDNSLGQMRTQERWERRRKDEQDKRDAEHKVDRPLFRECVRSGNSFMSQWKTTYGRETCLAALRRIERYPRREDRDKRMSPEEFEALLTQLQSGSRKSQKSRIAQTLQSPSENGHGQEKTF